MSFRWPLTALSKTVFLLTLLVAVTTLAWADGTQTGVVTGTILDLTGVPIQGVTVSLSGSQLERRAVTDPQGRFRFPALGVGGYRVAAELLSLRTPPSEVTVYVNKTSVLQLQLRQSDAAAATSTPSEEWIRAVVEAPVIDRYETRVGANVSFEFLEDLPVQRFYQSVALLLPGVSGGEGGNPNTSGALRGGNLFLVDGVDTTDPTTGLFGLNLAYEAVKEIEVTTAAAPVSYGRSSGAVINVVTRSGGQAFEGLARWVVTNNQWDDTHDVDRQLTPHLRPEIRAANAGPDDLNSTVALRLGGPIWPDRVFFSGSWEDSSRSFLRPTAFGQNWDEGSGVESGAFKLTAQLSSSHTVVAQHTYDAATFTTFAPFDPQPAENSLPQIPSGSLSGPFLGSRPGEIFALEDRATDGSFSKLQWNAALGQNLSLAVNLADQKRELNRAARNSRGVTADAPHIASVVFDDEGEEFEEFFFLNGITDEGFERRPRKQANVSAQYFRAGRVDHELNFGADYQETESQTLLNVPGQAGFDRATGRPVSGQLFFDLDETCDPRQGCFVFDRFTGEFQAFQLFNFWQRPLRETTEETIALYASDTISLRRWLFRFGLRYETVSGEDQLGSLVDDDGIAPRVAVSFDPRGDGKVLLQAAWGRYHEPFLQQYLDAFGLIEPLTGFTGYLWLGNPLLDDDDGGIFEPGCRDADPANLDSPCWFPIGVEPPFPLQTSARNTALRRSSVDELVLSFERQLSPRSGLALHYIDRRWNDLWDGRLDLGADRQPIVQVDQLPGAERSYRAIELLFQRRYAERWQLLASYTWSQAEGNFFRNDGFGTFGDFSAITDANVVNRHGPAPYDRPHQLRAHGSYFFGSERLGLSLAAALRYRDGVPYQLESLEAIDLGLDPDEDPGLEAVRFVTPRGSERLPGVFQLDLAANLDVLLAGEYQLELKAEVFNLTGEQEQTGAESLVDNGLFGAPRSLADLQAPRAYRLTLGLRF